MKITEKNSGLISSIVAWLVLAAVMLVIIPMAYRTELPVEYHFYHGFLFVSLVGIYYLNSKILLPELFEKRQKVLYFLSFIAISILLVFIMNLIEDRLNLPQLIHKALKPNEPYVPKSRGILVPLYVFSLTALMFFIGIASRRLRKWNLEEKKNIILQEQKSRAELDTLKAQINPHFFFNTLNTIYSLTFFDVEKSQEALLKLSKMMRYVMNEGGLEKVKLADEIAFIENYLELMRHRLPKNVHLKTEFPKDCGEAEIAPMILLTFVENCFKHGISTDKDCEIKIDLKLENGNLNLHTENENVEEKIHKNASGIGIENTLKRLNILYPGNFNYSGKAENGKYICDLNIRL